MILTQQEIQQLQKKQAELIQKLVLDGLNLTELENLKLIEKILE